MAWLISFVIVREAPGICIFNQFYFNSSLTQNNTCNTFMPPNFTCPVGENVALWRNISAPCDKEDCLFGLLENTQMIRLSSATGFLVTAGIFSATLSSALTSLISAPKVCLLVCLLVYLFVYLFTYLFTCLCTCLFTCFPVCLFVYMFVDLFTCLFTCFPVRSSSVCAETGYFHSFTYSV